MVYKHSNNRTVAVSLGSVSEILFFVVQGEHFVLSLVLLLYEECDGCAVATGECKCDFTCRLDFCIQNAASGSWAEISKSMFLATWKSRIAQ